LAGETLDHQISPGAGGLANALLQNSESGNGNSTPNVKGESGEEVETEGGCSRYRGLWLDGELGEGEEA